MWLRRWWKWLRRRFWWARLRYCRPRLHLHGQWISMPQRSMYSKIIWMWFTPWLFRWIRWSWLHKTDRCSITATKCLLTTWWNVQHFMPSGWCSNSISCMAFELGTYSIEMYHHQSQWIRCFDLSKCWCWRFWCLLMWIAQQQRLWVRCSRHHFNCFRRWICLSKWIL